MPEVDRNWENNSLGISVSDLTANECGRAVCGLGGGTCSWCGGGAAKNLNGV